MRVTIRTIMLDRRSGISSMFGKFSAAILSASVAVATPAHACSMPFFLGTPEEQAAQRAAYPQLMIETAADHIAGSSEVVFLGSAISWRVLDERTTLLKLNGAYLRDKAASVRVTTALKGAPPDISDIFYGVFGNMCVAGSPLAAGQEVLVAASWSGGQLFGDIYTVDIPPLLEALKRRGISARPE